MVSEPSPAQRVMEISDRGTSEATNGGYVAESALGYKRSYAQILKDSDAIAGTTAVSNITERPATIISLCPHSKNYYKAPRTSEIIDAVGSERYLSSLCSR